MKILVVGKNSQLGHECIKLLNPKHTIVGTTSSELDITSIRHVSQFINDLEPDIIINCAAYTDVENSSDFRELAFAVNTYGVNNLAVCAYCIEAKLIHISTDFVFDGRIKYPYQYVESDSCNPINPYGVSKYHGEVAVKSFSPNYAIVRTSWLYGIHGHNFIKTILNRIINYNIKSLDVISDQYGTPTSAFSLAKQLDRIIDNNLTGIIHASCNGSCTWFDFAKKIIDLLQLDDIQINKCKSSEYPSKVVRPDNSVLQNKVLQSHNLDIMPDWEDDLEQFINLNKDTLILGRVGANAIPTSL